MQKARRHTLKVLRPLVGRRVQGLLHSSIRGSFHLSLTVLVRYRSLGSIQPYGMGPANSHRISRVPRYSGYCQVHSLFRIQDFHLLRSNFPVCSSITNESTLQSYNPNNAETVLVWAGPRSLATTKGITFVFSSYGYLDVSVPHVRSPLCGVTCLLHAGLPHSEICGSIRMCQSPQLITSFIASESLGIHRLPLSILSPFRTQTICKSTDGCILIAIFCSTLFSRFLTNYVNDRLMVNPS